MLFSPKNPIFRRRRRLKKKFPSRSPPENPVFSPSRGSKNHSSQRHIFCDPPPSSRPLAHLWKGPCKRLQYFFAFIFPVRTAELFLPAKSPNIRLEERTPLKISFLFLIRTYSRSYTRSYVVAGRNLFSCCAKWRKKSGFPFFFFCPPAFTTMAVVRSFAASEWKRES